MEDLDTILRKHGISDNTAFITGLKASLKQLIVERERQLLEKLLGQVKEIHLTDLEMKQHHTGVSWEDVLLVEVLQSELKSLKERKK